MDHRGVTEQKQQGKRKQRQPRQGAHRARPGETRAKQRKMPDHAPVSVIDPKIVAILVQDKNLCREAPSKAAQ